jgi:hypothetical protein
MPEVQQMLSHFTSTPKLISSTKLTLLTSSLQKKKHNLKTSAIQTENAVPTKVQTTTTTTPTPTTNAL